MSGSNLFRLSLPPTSKILHGFVMPTTSPVHFRGFLKARDPTSTSNPRKSSPSSQLDTQFFSWIRGGGGSAWDSVRSSIASYHFNYPACLQDSRERACLLKIPKRVFCRKEGWGKLMQEVNRGTANPMCETTQALNR